MMDLQIIAFLVVLIEVVGLLFVPKKWVVPLTVVTIFTIIISNSLK